MSETNVKTQIQGAPSEDEVMLLRALKQAFDATSIISVTDARGVITYVNENFEKISGYMKSEIIGKTHSIVNSKHHPPEFWQEMWKTIATGQKWEKEVCNKSKSGQAYWVQSSVMAIKDISGKIAGYISIRHDISGTKRLESELRAGRRLQELIMETAPVGIFRTDSEGNCNYVNTNWTGMTGLTYEDSMNEGWITPIHIEDKYKVFGAWGDFVTGQAEFTMRWRFQRPDGSIRWVQGTAAAVRNDSGRIISYLGAAVDVTALIDAQTNLQHQQAELVTANVELHKQALELERASKAKSMFLANMSHEIRTPLNGVLGMGQVLATSELSPDAKNIVGDIISSGQMLMGIINDLLDFSKIDAGNMTIEKHRFAPQHAIKRTLALVNKTAAEKNLELILDVDANIPEYVIGDELRTRQILLNLLSNAIKFTAKGSVTIRAKWMEDTAPNGQIYFDVIDTGMGITPTQLQRLFNPFAQADDSITRRFGGTGLGLTIARRLAELMGGNITVKSTEGQGSKFSFSITVQAAEAEIENPIVPGIDNKDSKPSESISIKQLKILVAEDNATNQKLIKLLFMKFGVEHTLAQNGREAFDMATSQKWDVIFMDLQMPEMGGIDSAKAIRATVGPSQHAPIIALTANAFEDDKKACFDAGMTGFIAKPIRMSELQDALKKAAMDMPISVDDASKKVG